jgi:hypothetical protein
VYVVDLVDVLVDAFMMQQAMHPIKIEVFYHETQ